MNDIIAIKASATPVLLKPAPSIKPFLIRYPTAGGIDRVGYCRSPYQFGTATIEGSVFQALAAHFPDSRVTGIIVYSQTG
jgi:hypothetical protein